MSRLLQKSYGLRFPPNRHKPKRLQMAGRIAAVTWTCEHSGNGSSGRIFRRTFRTSLRRPPSHGWIELEWKRRVPDEGDRQLLQPKLETSRDCAPAREKSAAARWRCAVA